MDSNLTYTLVRNPKTVIGNDNKRTASEEIEADCKRCSGCIQSNLHTYIYCFEFSIAAASFTTSQQCLPTPNICVYINIYIYMANLKLSTVEQKKKTKKIQTDLSSAFV